MNKFIPDAGTHFYVKCKPRTQQVVVDDGFMAQKVQTIVLQDNSYSDVIFECIVSDETCIMAKSKFGGYSTRATMFKIDNYEFSPVGPDVLQYIDTQPNKD